MGSTEVVRRVVLAVGVGLISVGALLGPLAVPAAVDGTNISACSGTQELVWR